MNNYFMETHHHEWILTNRLGAYALGTGNLINQRKYHGLLIASDKSLNRTHLVAGMEEKVEWRGEVIHLDSNNYSNCIYPEGFLHLVKPWLRPYPAFLYSALPHQNDILILKEIMMDEQTNTVLVKYTNLGHHRLHFEFHPKFTLTAHHELNPAGSLDHTQFDTKIQVHKTDSANTVETIPSSKDIKTEFNASGEGSFVSFSACRPEIQVCVYGALLRGEVIPNRYVYYNVFYPWEVMSGYSGVGDQISLFQLAFDLKVGESNCILFSDTAIDNAKDMISRIEERYADLPKPNDFPKAADQDDTLLNSIDYNDNFLFKYDDYMKILEFALTDFLVNDDVVAGYPIYGAWGRDTMVVLNAFLHKPDSLDIVERILNKYSGLLKNGLIPNMLAESGREANYDTVDATLWFVILLWKLGKQKKDVNYWTEKIALIESILTAIINNFSYPFDVRKDGLIELHEEFAHGTWMDVRIDGKPITPRSGAPVEINALWYNALCSYEAMCVAYAKATGKENPALPQMLELKERVLDSMGKFWHDGFLADRLKGNEPVIEIRPNAILALSLPWPVFSRDKMEKVLERAFMELYTNYGIRTLSPRDMRFRKKYYGTQRERDMSYHNGSVWAWLLGAFCGLYVKTHTGVRPDKEIRETLSSFIQTFRESFMRGHIASVAEIWDGDAPHFPKGAPAQAWSVAALYNIEGYIAKLGEEK
ncbi:MAG: amylo-alpha-1,6-glucosidase [Candidatus Cloacimonetes bacterium]|nr:amylo-alpha-1,6-glucosidase [Candidatus Cloacimonadota bacterium]